MRFKQNFTPYQYLPAFAKVAIERLDADSSLRNSAMLNELLDAYAKAHGTTCDAHDRASSHYLCSRRFSETFVIDPKEIQA